MTDGQLVLPMLVLEEATGPDVEYADEWVRGEHRRLCESCSARRTRGLYRVRDVGGLTVSACCWECWTQGARLDVRPVGDPA